VVVGCIFSSASEPGVVLEAIVVSSLLSGVAGGGVVLLPPLPKRLLRAIVDGSDDQM
jgi:hypothetical protein